MMTMAPISIIMPCFNSAKTLERAILSISRQTLQPCEVIAVDDASTDGTVNLLERIKLKYPELNLKIIKLEQNAGPATARNTAWNLAIGKFIAFIDSDDSWHPQKLETQYNFMLSHPDAFLCGHLSQTLSEDFLLSEKKEIVVQSQAISAKKLLHSNCFLTRTVMLKNDPAFRFKDGKRHSEDYLLWLQICLSNYRCYLLHNVLAFSYKNDFGESGLSAQVFKMERGELANYLELFKIGKINFLMLIWTTCFSMVKFIKRLLIIGLRKSR